MPSQANFTEGNVKTMTAGTALGIFLRVKHGTSGTAGQAILATASENGVGCTERPVFAQGETVPVRLRTAPGTCPMVASVAIAAGGDVFAAASGKVAATGTILVGTAMQAAAADNDIIEVLRV